MMRNKNIKPVSIANNLVLKFVGYLCHNFYCTSIMIFDGLNDGNGGSGKKGQKCVFIKSTGCLALLTIIN